MNKTVLLSLAAFFSLSTAAFAEAPKVVASIKPIHSLVAAVMGDLGTPALLVGGANSPHSYSLKPSDAQALQSANLVFWTGHGLELFLEDSIGSLAPNATIVELGESAGIELLPPREAGTFEPHDHAHEGDDHAHEGEDHDHDHAHEGDDHGHETEADMHFFLDPANAKVMVAAIADSLTKADPDNAAVYRANAAAETADLDALIAEVTATLAPVQDRPFVVFHDAYQYFESRFGLNLAGSITVSPDQAPGADRISQIRDKLKSLDAACVFAEPNFSPSLIGVLTEGTTAKAGTLDPEGSTLDEGPGLYRTLITGLADNLASCLAR